jgi:enamine deaminase RidA (YjgF/YER057c/UK114 family)
VQLWGIAPKDETTSVVTVEDPVNGRARLLKGNGFRLLHLPSVKASTLARDAAEQARQMFMNVRFGLEAHGFCYPNVVRTWIYIARLLEWYGDFNRVRTAIYRESGLGSPAASAFPASTGIMGHSAEEECVMDVLALDPTGHTVAQAVPIHRSPRQDSSFNYGSAFSRGMVLDIEGRKTVHISGTASINPAGQSIHVGNAELQSFETLMCIASILEAQGGGLSNITSATLFCKNHAAWEAWQRVTALLQIPDFPKLCVQADVCRHDLLVEMEVVATL